MHVIGAESTIDRQCLHTQPPITINNNQETPVLLNFSGLDSINVVREFLALFSCLFGALDVCVLGWQPQYPYAQMLAVCAVAVGSADLQSNTEGSLVVNQGAFGELDI
jgi:hypothetical protein